MKIDDYPRVHLAHLPTPIEDAPRLAKRYGLSRLLIKRDDQTGLTGGGNKARKLEYLMGDALAKGADVILTDGGPQSNHARMTAGAARKLGLDVRLVLAGPDFDEFQGNLLLDVLLGAEILFLRDKDVPEMEDGMSRIAEELRAQGRTPYIVPIGGSTPVGALGYVRAMEELRGQIGDEPVQIVLAVGSCGTFVGTVLGAKIHLPQAQIHGISVSSRNERIYRRTTEIANETARMIDAGITVDQTDFHPYDRYFGTAYGIPTEAGNAAILDAARLEGLLLDPVYTGKAMSGLADLARTGVLDPSRPVVFIHTGGVPGLFAFHGEFQDQAVCRKQ